MNLDLIGTVRGDTYFKCIDFNFHIFHFHWKYKDHIAISLSKLKELEEKKVKTIKIRVLNCPYDPNLLLVITLKDFLETSEIIKFNKKNCDIQKATHINNFQKISIHQEVLQIG